MELSTANNRIAELEKQGDARETEKRVMAERPQRPKSLVNASTNNREHSTNSNSNSNSNSSSIISKNDSNSNKSISPINRISPTNNAPRTPTSIIANTVTSIISKVRRNSGDVMLLTPTNHKRVGASPLTPTTANIPATVDSASKPTVKVRVVCGGGGGGARADHKAVLE
jgi:hypothetical protein